MSQLRVGVIGVGYLGRFHAQKYAQLADVELTGVFDVDAARARSVAAESGCAAFADAQTLIAAVDAVSIASNTPSHYDLVAACLKGDCHVFVEKPITETSTQAAELVQLATQRNLKLQVGHIERFNPALIAAREHMHDVRFIECHRLAAFKHRGADVDVVLDLMIHDLDVILSIVDSEPAEVSAMGLPVLTDKVDIANARIEFNNGAVANVTASRVSTSAQRKLRVFQAQQYMGIDFGSVSIQRVTRSHDWDGTEEPLDLSEMSYDRGDALLVEIESFIAAIRDDRPVIVSGHDGQRVLELAETILERMTHRSDGPQTHSERATPRVPAP
jgi:predicted dehydrogenase